MVFAPLAKLKRNSVPTTIAAPGITAVATTIPVTETSRFYDVDGTLITRGIMIGGDNANSILPEEITITGCSVAYGVGGPGDLTGATRGLTPDGTIGAAAAWPAGTNIAVTLTISWWNIIKDNFAAIFPQGNAWAAWTDTLTWATATPTGITNVARWTQIGKTVFIDVLINVADSKGTTGLTIALPVAHASNNINSSLACLEGSGAGGTTYTNPFGTILTNSTTIQFLNFTAMTNGQAGYIRVTGQYEVA